jgi:hypothetical protein
MRTIIALSLALLLAGCPKDRTDDTDLLAHADTMPMDLDSLVVDLPPVEPDTFTPPPVRRAETTPARPQYPDAPPALLEAVRREQSFSRFCYEEFGQKEDPRLSGGVAMLVTIGPAGVTAVRVEHDTWTSGAGKNVNECLVERAPLAWKVTGGTVRPGQYVVQLGFRPS